MCEERSPAFTVARAHACIPCHCDTRLAAGTIGITRPTRAPARHKRVDSQANAALCVLSHRELGVRLTLSLRVRAISQMNSHNNSILNMHNTSVSDHQHHDDEQDDNLFTKCTGLAWHCTTTCRAMGTPRTAEVLPPLSSPGACRTTKPDFAPFLSRRFSSPRASATWHPAAAWVWAPWVAAWVARRAA